MADLLRRPESTGRGTFLNLPRIRSLRTRIALLCVGVCAVLAVGLSALGYSMAARGLRESTKTTLHAEGLVTANLAEGWARDRLASLRAVASSRRVRGYLETATAPAAEDQAAADVAIGDAASMAEEIESIALLDSHGNIAVSSSTADTSGNLSNDDHVKAALTGSTSITGVRQSSISQLPGISLAVPVLGSNATPIGLVRASLTLSPLTAFVEAARDRAGPGANGTLIDQNGLVIASTLSPGLAGHALAVELPELASVVENTGRELLQLRFQGIEQLAVVEPLPGTHWVYVASLPLAVAERTAQQFLRRAVLAAAVSLVGAMLLSIFVASRIVRSLVRLTEVSARIVSGNLTQQIEISSDDEVGVLASGFARMVEALREVLGTLKGSSAALSAASNNLTVMMQEQSDFISRQAASLQETQVTAQEIKQTSALASERARAVLAVAEHADELGRAGESAVERSVAGLQEISAQAIEVGNRIHELSGRARQIGEITLTVKDLADQSNMLALNAAIEAVRSGEHGRSFAVVAREIRSLADQSIQATARVKEILGDLNTSILSTATISEKSTKRMESGLSEVKISGESLREMAGIARENSSAVRTIADAVGQQNAGIGCIFTAVSEQMQMMEHMRSRIEQTSAASAELRKVAEHVASTLSRYQL